MELSKETISLSKALFKEEKMAERLQAIYHKIPEGSCNGCASCCVESVHAFYTEFLSIHQYLIDANQLDEMMKKIEDHYFNELTRKQPCPFLDEKNRCIIYEVRPHVCRLFGHSTREEHDQNYAAILEQNMEANNYFKENYKVSLPDEVVYHKINFCEFFCSEIKFSQKEKLSLIDELFMLETNFLMDDLIDDEMLNMSITNWFIYTKYTEEVASEMRIKKLTDSKK